MPDISPRAIVEASAGLAEDVQVGPFCHVGPEVKIGPGTVLHAQVTVTGRTTIGARCQIFPGCVVGAAPPGVGCDDAAACTIADDNVLREHVVVEAGADRSGPGTVFGEGNLLMVGSYVGHDATLEGHGIFPNFTRIEPHARVEPFVQTAGFTVVRPYVTVGAYAFTTGYADVARDVPPYAIVQGLPARVRSVNSEKLRRCGFDEDTIAALRKAFHLLFNRNGAAPDAQRLATALEEFPNEHVGILIDSLRQAAASPSGRRLAPPRTPEGGNGYVQPD